MVNTDWFRHVTWDEEVERGFNEKLRRARRKAQYIRIQASTLTTARPEIALKLLDQYFALNDILENAMAHVNRAEAFLALGRVNDAVDSYEAALAHESEFPKLQTQAYLYLPYLIATHGIQEKFDRAGQILEKYKARLMFPVDYFLWNAAHALMAASVQNSVLARTYAKRALEAANQEQSGFRYHPMGGLVTEQYDSLIQKLEEYCAA